MSTVSAFTSIPPYAWNYANVTLTDCTWDSNELFTAIGNYEASFYHMADIQPRTPATTTAPAKTTTTTTTMTTNNNNNNNNNNSNQSTVITLITNYTGIFPSTRHSVHSL